MSSPTPGCAVAARPSAGRHSRQLRTVGSSSRPTLPDPGTQRHSARRITLARPGFTLVELTTVLTLVGILASIAVPSLSAKIGTSRTQATLDRLAADLSHTRTLAVQNRSRATLSFQDSGYTVAVSGASGTQAVKTVDWPTDDPHLTVTPPTNVTEFVFNSRGMLVSDGASVDQYIKAVTEVTRDSIFVTRIGEVRRD